MELEYAKDSKEQSPYEHYMKTFQKADPAEISARTFILWKQQSMPGFWYFVTWWKDTALRPPNI